MYNYQQFKSFECDIFAWNVPCLGKERIPIALSIQVDKPWHFANTYAHTHTHTHTHTHARTHTHHIEYVRKIFDSRGGNTIMCLEISRQCARSHVVAHNPAFHEKVTTLTE